jgi:hypothetical protein
MFSRRRVTTAVVVVATGSVATVAVAAGPVIYSQYTTGGDRENRVVQDDGSDTPLPIDVNGAAVSPDGRRIAQTTLQTAPQSEGRFASSLRVTAGDGSGAITLLQSSSSDEGRIKIVTGMPVWSPDSTRVLVYRTELRSGGAGRTARVICTVETKACADAGAVAKGSLFGSESATLRVRGLSDDAALTGDVVAWQQTDGPVVQDAVRERRGLSRVRCGTVPGVIKAPTVRLRGLSGSSFGDALALRGLRSGDDLDPKTAGALAVPSGTLVVDLPSASTRTGRIRCDRDSGTAVRRTTIGTARVRLRAAGRTTSLPTPPGLRKGDGLRLVGTDDGGAVLVSATVDAEDVRLFCNGSRRSRIRDCSNGYSDSYRYGDDESERPLRVWRYVTGPAPHFERITTARRSALKTLQDATDLTVASGDAVLAVTDGAIERVPLDGGAPTTVARGRGISLDLSGW